MTSKTKLNLFCQKSRIDVPNYSTERTEDGFVSSVIISGCHHRSEGVHGTKKAAEDDAASVALEALLAEHPSCSSVDEMIEWVDRHWRTKPGHTSPYPPIPHMQRVPTPGSRQQNSSVFSRGPGGFKPNPHANSDYPVVKSNDQTLLEDFCCTHGLGKPEYHISSKKPDRFCSTVTIGNSVYSTDEEYDDCEAAKDSCTTLALAALGVRDLKISERGSSSPQQVRTTLQNTSSSSVTPSGSASKQASISLHNDTEQVRGSPSSKVVSGKGKIVVSVTSTKGQGTPQKQDPQQMNSQFRVPPIHPGKQSITQPRVNSALQQRSGQLPSLPRPQSSPVYAPSHPPRGRSAQPATTIHPPSQAVSRLPPGNYKQVLNEYCQKSRVSLPKYTCEYPEDTVGYIACVSVRGKEYRSPPQPSKKVAEMMAAAEAISDLGILTGPVSEKGKPGPPQTVSQSIPSPVEAGHGQGTGTRFVSYKNLLQEFAQKSKVSLPRYETMRMEEGFQSTVSLHHPSGDMLTFTSGGYPVKKAAEQEAAKIACTELSLLPK